MKHHWKIHIKNLEARIGVGIHEHEQGLQRILVNATVEGEYAAKPKTIDECFNYEDVVRLVIRQWPREEHKPLIENCVTDLLEHIFKCDDRVSMATVHICKPDIFSHAEYVGAETTWTRKDFKKISS